VHPQSIIHSMVQFSDGAVKAQLGAPDMRLPIQYALSYPIRIPLSTERINFSGIGQLTFFAPDIEKFPALGLAYEAYKKGGNMPCIMNAANEVAVEAFLKEELSFCKIPVLIERTMNRAGYLSSPSIEQIFETDNEAKLLAKEILNTI
jgi:1-deoxy-D-xylulose-5-phosphate reductoisomerase